MHCNDLTADREVGRYWEQRFCDIARCFRKSITLHQCGQPHAAIASFERGSDVKHKVLPDITIWDKPSEHHEIKHKAPTKDGAFGLERYRFEGLMWFAAVTGQEVRYTIHDHSLAGGRDVTTNLIEHWFTASVRDLDQNWSHVGHHDSWVDGQRKTVEIYYWKRSLFMPVLRHFKCDDSEIYVRIFSAAPIGVAGL